MKLKVPRKNRNTPSGTYQVAIVESEVRKKHPQLKLTLEVLSPGGYEGNFFYYCLMLEGPHAGHFLSQLLQAALPNRNPNDTEFDDSSLIGARIVVEIENGDIWDPLNPEAPNFYPRILKIVPVSVFGIR